MAWELDARTSQALLTVHQKTQRTLHGRIGVIYGYLHIDSQNPVHSWVDLGVDAANDDADHHVDRGHNHASVLPPDRRVAQWHPLLTFTSTRLEHVEGPVYTLSGDLTIRGTTQPITFDALFHGERDGDGLWRPGLFARTKIARTDVGSAADRIVETVFGDANELTSMEIVFDLFQQPVVEQRLASIAA